MYKQTTLPSSFSFRTSFFVGFFGLFLVSSTVLFAQENSTHESEEVIHKRGERAQWLQPGKRAMQNRARMQHLERNRKDDSSLPRLQKAMELETELMAERLNLSNEQLEMLHFQQDALIEKYSRARLEIEKEVKQKREEMNHRRNSMRKIHQENPEARPSKEVREAMQMAIREENETLLKEMTKANRALMSSLQNDRMLILFDILNDEQYRDYLEQRSSIRKEIQAKRSR